MYSNQIYPQGPKGVRTLRYGTCCSVTITREIVQWDKFFLNREIAQNFNTWFGYFWTYDLDVR